MSNIPQPSPELPPYAVYDLVSGNPREGVATVSVLGDLAAFAQMSDGPLVRLQSACVPGEIAVPADCDCGPQLVASRQQIIAQSAGVLFYLYQEEWGHGREDHREYGHCARFLLERNVSRVRLLTNNFHKLDTLKSAGLIVKHEPLILGPA